jgi:hypothetical protein
MEDKVYAIHVSLAQRNMVKPDSGTISSMGKGRQTPI